MCHPLLEYISFPFASLKLGNWLEDEIPLAARQHEVVELQLRVALRFELPVVQISKSAEIYLGKDPVNINRLVEEVHSKYPGQTSVYLRADGETPFDPIASVMSVLGDAKLSVNVVTQPDDKIGKRR